MNPLKGNESVDEAWDNFNESVLKPSRIDAGIEANERMDAIMKRVFVGGLYSATVILGHTGREHGAVGMAEKLVELHNEVHKLYGSNTEHHAG